MKTVWLFGGSKKTFGQTLVNGFENVILFGRDNVNYSDIDGFIQSIEDNSIYYPIPDLIIFNISNNGHEYVPNRKITPRYDIDILIDIIKTTFFFQLRLSEWFFSTYKNKRILYITSRENNNNYRSDHIAEDTHHLMLYRMSRALEHQIIHQQNILKENIENNNIIMGICVGNNLPEFKYYINQLILNNNFKRNIYGLGSTSLTHGELHTEITRSDNEFPIYNPKLK